MCTGQSGLGKSTLMNTLFKSKVSRKSFLGTAEEKIPKTIEIKSISHGKAAQLYFQFPTIVHLCVIYPFMHGHSPIMILISKRVVCHWNAIKYLISDIEEKGVRMKLTVIDTPGFGDQINNENW